MITKAYNLSYYDAIMMTPLTGKKETKDCLEIVNPGILHI